VHFSASPFCWNLSDGDQGNYGFYVLSISANGRYVALELDARNPNGDTNEARDVFVYERE
jgi:hypothetical protein